MRCHTLHITTARSLLVDSESAGFYHCISRCIRLAWLCGVDPCDGKSCEHRGEWVEGRLLELAEIFAVGIYPHALMSNRVHVVLRIDLGAARLMGTKKCGVIDAAEPPILRKLGLSEWQWSTQVLGAGTRYWRAVGGAQSMIEKAAAIGQSWESVGLCRLRREFGCVRADF